MSPPGDRPPVEARLALWAFALNFIWEMLQGGLYVGMVEMRWWGATSLCLRAAAGDALMIVAAYAAVGAAARDRRWIRSRGIGKRLAYALVAAVLALAVEWWSLRAGRWRHGPGMPRDPVWGLGLAPLLQWAFIPLVCLAVVRPKPPRTTAPVARRPHRDA